MSYKITTHHTPNESTRGGVAPRFFVMHVTEGGFDGAVSWLCNPAAQASADEVVNIAGDQVAVLNTARSKLKTWAVGNGNPQSMSWENEGFGGKTHWPQSHYDTLADRLVRAQAAVRKTYGVTIPLERTTSPSKPGICGHGDMARWFGGSDHFTCPGTTFDFHALEAAIQRRLHPAPAYTKRDLWAWAAWYVGVGRYKHHRRDPQTRPARVPMKVPAAGWKLVAWYVKHPVKAVVTKPKPQPKPVPHLQILDDGGHVIREAKVGRGASRKLVSKFGWYDHAKGGDLTVRVVEK